MCFCSRCLWCLWRWSSNISSHGIQFINVNLSLMSIFTCINMFAVWTVKNHCCPLSHFRWWVVVSDCPTWDLNCAFPLFQQTLVIDDMWWSKLNKINDLCCCNEKDFFFFCSHGFHSSLMETWMNWMSVPHLQGQGDKYYAWLLLCHVWLPAEKQLFHSAVLTARHVLFQIKPSRSQSHLFVSKWRQNRILRNNNKFTVDVRNHNKFLVS